MTDPNRCENEFDAAARTVDQAQEAILDNITLRCDTIVSPLRAALGQVLADDIRAPFDVPPHRNSAMDGFAFAGADLDNSGTTTLRLAGKALAGRPFQGTLQPSECVQITTGAVMPSECDSVVMQEVASVAGNLVTFAPGIQPFAHVRQAGEDLQRDTLVLTTGKRLTPADLGLLASLGMEEVLVYRAPRVAFFSTGDEVVDPGNPLLDGQIYDSNRYTLWGLITQTGAEPIDMGILPDTPEAVREGMLLAAGKADLVITSGGASVGEADYISHTLKDCGELNFWKIAMKPGRPLTFGKIRDTLFFGLPGNPVAVMATFHIFIKPALAALQGQVTPGNLHFRARLLDNIRKTPGRTDYQRGIIEVDGNGETVVHSTGTQGSHILRSMSQANCFIVVPRDAGNLSAGDIVDVMLL